MSVKKVPQALEKGYGTKYKVEGKDMKIVHFTTFGKVIPSLKLKPALV